jgi:hypothetical protein
MQVALRPSYIPSPSHHHVNITNHRSITIVQPAIVAMCVGVTRSFPIFGAMTRMNRPLPPVHHVCYKSITIRFATNFLIRDSGIIHISGFPLGLAVFQGRNVNYFSRCARLMIRIVATVGGDFRRKLWGPIGKASGFVLAWNVSPLSLSSDPLRCHPPSWHVLPHCSGGPKRRPPLQAGVLSRSFYQRGNQAQNL